MVNKPKIQGTKEETWNVGFYSEVEGFSARRVAEGGMYDETDVEVITGAARVLVESKARANLNPHQTLKKSIAKADLLPGQSVEKDMRNHIPGYGVAVSHKKLVDKGGKRRVADGELRVVSITPEYFRYLLEQESRAADSCGCL